MTRSLLSLVALLLGASPWLAGCTAQHTPYITYEEQMPLSATAVFLAMDQEAQTYLTATIKKMDGREMPCLQNGCPYWVRVKPGTHHFVIDYRSNIALKAGFVTLDVAAPEVTVRDMKPRRVYKARYKQVGDKVEVTIIDLGENPNVCLDFSYMGCHRASFEDKKP